MNPAADTRKPVAHNELCRPDRQPARTQEMRAGEL